MIKCKDEHFEISEKLRAANQTKQFEVLSPRNAVSLDDIIIAVEEEEPHILHFCAHGMEKEINPEGKVSQKGGIVVFSKSKRSYEVLDAELLRRQFRVIKKDFPKLKVVFFNACHGAPQAKAISEHGIYAIGTTEAILDAGAPLFAAGFYQNLARKNDILLAISGGIRRAISEEPEIEHLIECYYNGQRLYPKA